MQTAKQDGVRALERRTGARPTNARGGACGRARTTAAAIGVVAVACGGATQLLVPVPFRNSSVRFEIESLNATAPSRMIGNYQVTFFQSSDRGREVLSSGATVARWAVGANGPSGQAALDCEARYGALGKGPSGGPASVSMKCDGRGAPMTLVLAGPGQRQGVGKLVLQGVEYEIEAVYDVENGKPPTTPAGYAIRRSFDVVAAAEAIGPEDPGAVYLSTHVEEPRRTALMTAATALVELGVLAPKPTGAP
jgi:hypothetical protein